MRVTDQLSETSKGVSISVSYAWEKADDVVVGPRQDARWKELRTLIKGVQDEVQTRLDKVSSPVELPQRLRRLRARHGGWILDSLRSRLAATDIYVADLGNSTGDGLNYNVLLEVGMAIALGLGNRGNMFILIPEGLSPPSDLSGLLLTQYRRSEAVFTIVDLQGFRAALRASILSVAIDKGLYMPSPRGGDPQVEDEADGA